MRGIDLDKAITFLYSSLRFFADNEHHVTRFCGDDVLVMVYEGVLRFDEDGVSYEVHPGEYHIQKAGSYQSGVIASDSPKYLYVHFHSLWDEEGASLPYRGNFDYQRSKPFMEKLDAISHSGGMLTEKTAIFYELLLMLMPKEKTENLAHRIADYLSREYMQDISLDKICDEFHFSKNHIINIFIKEFGITPIKHINNTRLQRAEYFLEVTSDSAEEICRKCGFNDYSQFYKLFCRENGMPPSVWRRKKQKEPVLI